jgi:hypothetical protein
MTQNGDIVLKGLDSEDRESVKDVAGSAVSVIGSNWGVTSGSDPPGLKRLQSRMT